MFWIILTDTTTCRIYSCPETDSQLTLVKQLEHPQSRLRDQELVAGKPGHYKASNNSHSSYEPHTDPHEGERDHFAKQLADELDAGRGQNYYAKLIVIAPSHMHGLLNKHLNKHVDALIVSRVNKDYMHLSETELHKFLQDNWRDILNNNFAG